MEKDIIWFRQYHKVKQITYSGKPGTKSVGLFVKLEKDYGVRRCNLDLKKRITRVQSFKTD